MTGLICSKQIESGNYTFELKARKTGGNEGFLIYFGMSENNKKGYLFNIGGWGNTQTAMEKIEGGTTVGIVSEQLPFTVETNKWYSIKIVRIAGEMLLWVDGKEIIRYKAVSPLHQFAVAGYDQKSGEVIIKVVNADEKPWLTSLKINNSVNVTSGGEVITLTAPNLKDENSFEEPFKISPKSAKYTEFSKDFDYEFGPASFTILRIKATK